MRRSLPAASLRRCWFRSFVAAGSTAMATLLAAAPALAQDPDAGSVVDQVLAAYGGADALRATHALRLEGSIVTHAGAEVHGSFVRIDEGGSGLKVLLHYPDHAEIRVVDGDEGWHGSSPTSLAPAQGPMLAAMQLQAARSWVPWILVDLRDRLQVERSDDTVTVLGADLKRGLHLRFFVDASSHRVLRTESEMAMASMSMVFASDYGDFQQVGGILLPFREESFASGTHTATLSVEKAIPNPPDDQRKLPTGRAPSPSTQTTSSTGWAAAALKRFPSVCARRITSTASGCVASSQSSWNASSASQK